MYVIKKLKDQIYYCFKLCFKWRINRRLRRKSKKGQKINVIFVCHRPSVWGSLKGVYDLLNEDYRFETSIIAIPAKKEISGNYFDHEVYESEGAEEYWKENGCINGYDYSTHEWFDLNKLKPDYVFFQQPYNITLPKQYKSRIVSRYAKMCYVDYFAPICLDDVYEDCTPIDYLRDLSFFFTQNDDDNEFIVNRYKETKSTCRIVQTGFPRFDSIDRYQDSKCDLWKRDDTFKNTRWTTNEGNCHFFDYKDKMIDLCKNRDDIELAYRPHPQAFKEWAATGEMNDDEQKRFLACFGNSNLHLDESFDFFPLMFSSDCLITDYSSLIVDYYCTKKPIIYCTSNGSHDAVVPALEKGLYKAENWEELVVILERLIKGDDPLKNDRERIYSEYLKSGGDNAGAAILHALAEDALGRDDL